MSVVPREPNTHDLRGNSLKTRGLDILWFKAYSFITGHWALWVHKPWHVRDTSVIHKQESIRAPMPIATTRASWSEFNCAQPHILFTEHITTRSNMKNPTTSLLLPGDMCKHEHKLAQIHRGTHRHTAAKTNTHARLEATPLQLAVCS